MNLLFLSFGNLIKGCWSLIKIHWHLWSGTLGSAGPLLPASLGWFFFFLKETRQIFKSCVCVWNKAIDVEEWCRVSSVPPQPQWIPVSQAPLSTLVPRLRCSVEGLNQELEGVFICHPQNNVTVAPNVVHVTHDVFWRHSPFNNPLVSCPSVSWGPRWPQGSGPSAELQQWFSKWPDLGHHTLILRLSLSLPLLLSVLCL